MLAILRAELVFQHSLIQYTHCPSLGLLTRCLGMSKGCLLARAYASVIVGDDPSVLMTLPIDMKNLNDTLKSALSGLESGQTQAYPNVAAEPNIYCPNVLMTPLGPAPNLMILKPPIFSFLVMCCADLRCWRRRKPKTKPMIRPTANQ